MLLNLGTIISVPGGIVPFDLTLDYSDLQFGNDFPASEPVTVSGRVRNEAGVLLLEAKMNTTLHCICDRCAMPFEKDFSLDVSALLVTALENEDTDDENIYILEGDCADLDEILSTAFVLNMDAKVLCSPDCKGLCFSCGKNLNEGPCDCLPEPDPRMAVLKQLLQDKE